MSQSPMQTLRGFRDFSSLQAIQREWLKDRITQTFQLWGFDPLETPTLEPLELFAGQIGEDEKLFFTFQDPGGRDVALRYDQTVPTCRFVGTNIQSIPLPFIRYQLQPVFRAEKPQRGRYREFVQCDADIFGVASPPADAEMIALSLDIYRQLGFKNPLVLINDRSLLKTIPYQAISSIDKLKKIGEHGVIEETISKGIAEETATTYLRHVTTLKPNETISLILDYLKKQGFSDEWYRFEPTIARSFSYSDGPIWEIEIQDFSGGSVLGGERFDGLVEKVSGVSVPGTGFGVGFDRTLEAAEALGLIPSIPTRSVVMVAGLDKEYLDEIVAVCATLRAAKIPCELYPDFSEKMSKQLKFANKKQIPYVVLVGEDEVKQKVVTLKNMTSGEQRLVPLSSLVSSLQEPKFA